VPREWSHELPELESELARLAHELLGSLGDDANKLAL
jgi:hypothetical protein